MFVGALNSTVRKYLANVAQVFDGKTVVIGCSGNFTSEAVLTRCAKPLAVHSNDVSFYSCMLGRFFTGKPLEFDVADSAFDWLEPFLHGDLYRMASIMVLLDALEFEKQNTAYRKRMWEHYLATFPELVEATAGRLQQVDVKVTSFFAGDVWDHFLRFTDDPSAVFCCYAPTYAGGYERLYKRLDSIVSWDEPTYPMLDDERRDALLHWMTERPFLWYDDRILDGMVPVMRQRSGRRRTVYLYSNLVQRPAVFDDRQPGGLPRYQLADATLEIGGASSLWLHRIKTSELARFKDAFLGKQIEYGEGMWAFAVVLDGVVVGFLEFAKSRYGRSDEVYLMADFAVPGTTYRRLSKLLVMVARSGEMRRVLEKTQLLRTRSLLTTAFTDHPVSMKYRGVLSLVKRGQTEDGEAFLNYGGQFDDSTLAEVLREWLTKHGSVRS